MISSDVYFITGATGNIGRRIVYYLVQSSNIHVIAGCRDIDKAKYIFSDLVYNSNFEITHYDINDGGVVEYSYENIDYIIHCAGICKNIVCKTTPQEVLDVNINGMFNVCKLASKLAVKKLLFISSASVYGDTNNQDNCENTYGKIEFDNVGMVYSESKRCAELICSCYAEKIPICIVRPFHILSKEELLEKGSLLEDICSAAINMKKVKLRGDGKQKRNFTYIDDMIGALVYLCHHETGCFNIGNKCGTITIYELTEKIINILKRRGIVDAKSEIDIVFEKDKYKKQTNNLDMVPNLDKLNSIYNESKNFINIDVALERVFEEIGDVKYENV